MTAMHMPARILCVVGARPNFMKIAPIISALEQRQAAGGPLRYRLVHTGQHYDARMSGDFFEQLGIPAPDVNLEVGSGTQAEQAGAIMVRYEAPSCLVATPALAPVHGYTEPSSVLRDLSVRP